MAARNQPRRQAKRSSIDPNAVEILVDHTIRAAGSHFTFNRFRRATSVTSIPSGGFRTGRLHHRQIDLVGKLIDALLSDGIDEPEMIESLWQYIGSDAALRAQFSPLDLTVPNAAGRITNSRRWRRLNRSRNRYRHRIARPITKKTKLTRFESRGVRELNNYLGRMIPKRRQPPRLNSPESQYLYHIPGTYITTDKTNGRIERLAAQEQLREAARADPSRANDWLAFEDQTTDDDNTDVWKVLTRAQLSVQKAESLVGLAQVVFTDWNTEVEQEYP